MKIGKMILLYLLFLIAMVVCSTAVMKIFDMFFSLGFEDTWDIGFKVGFLSWLILSVISVVNMIKKHGKDEGHNQKDVE